ncbi:helicase [Philodulcilactobacillus myokoensis]|uniref:Helicase n=1 Tax=Philodulcilactobacillus myokoensis TaxID=2929573 RepID=A0A9W6ESH8_9LACO|nr:DEAD/DEAH box helicase [Philodulcilactobacillus myokoensis]GLB47061.1 helicase [Philodulcilactobacillus myokoensis]
MNPKLEQRFNHLYQKPTAIQSKVYQPILNGKDVLGLSPTGSGKTLAFALPILDRLSNDNLEKTRVMIFEPSQELAMQVTQVIRQWSKIFNIKPLALIGSANVKRQVEKLKKQHPKIIIGTPGRILNLAEDHKLKLDGLKMVVIDEADDLLQGDTLESVRDALNEGPSDAQLMYFSATDTEILHHLKKWFGRDAERIDVRKIDDTRGQVKHGLLKVSRAKRNQMLNRLLHVTSFKGLVFFNEMRDLNHAYSYFTHNHVNNVAKLTGDLNQVKRQHALKQFRLGQVKLLLTTDIAARGLDIKKLPAVVNYDLPTESNQYIHRVGRTGRMGEPGLVLNFGDDHDFRDLRHMLAETEYHFQPIYYYHNHLVDYIGHQSKTKEKSSPKAKQNIINHHQNVSYKKVNHKKKNHPMISKRVKKHRNKKHTKNKGMRHKWMKEDQKHHSK